MINAELEKRVQERIAQLEAAIHGFSRILMNECTPQLSERTKHYLEDLPTFSLVAQALGDLRAETGPSVEIAVSGLPPCQGARKLKSKWAHRRPQTGMPRSTTCEITESASTCDTPTNCSGSSSACTTREITPALASAWRTCRARRRRPGTGVHLLHRRLRGPRREQSSQDLPLDLKLPKVDGLEVLRRAKADARTCAIPIVVFSSSSEDRDLEQARERGALT